MRPRLTRKKNPARCALRPEEAKPGFSPIGRPGGRKSASVPLLAPVHPRHPAHHPGQQAQRPRVVDGGGNAGLVVVPGHTTRCGPRGRGGWALHCRCGAPAKPYSRVWVGLVQGHRHCGSLLRRRGAGRRHLRTGGKRGAQRPSEYRACNARSHIGVACGGIRALMGRQKSCVRHGWVGCPWVGAGRLAGDSRGVPNRMRRPRSGLPVGPAFVDCSSQSVPWRRPHRGGGGSETAGSAVQAPHPGRVLGRMAVQVGRMAPGQVGGRPCL